jgi:hypothetical protein
MPTTGIELDPCAGAGAGDGEALGRSTGFATGAGDGEASDRLTGFATGAGDGEALDRLTGFATGAGDGEASDRMIGLATGARSCLALVPALVVFRSAMTPVRSIKVSMVYLRTNSEKRRAGTALKRGSRRACIGSSIWLIP